MPENFFLILKVSHRAMKIPSKKNKGLAWDTPFFPSDHIVNIEVTLSENSTKVIVGRFFALK